MSGYKQFVIKLPSINGAIETGLSVGTDVGLEDALKLPILNISDRNEAAGYAAGWAYKKFQDCTDQQRKIYTTAAFVVVGAGLYGHRDTFLDGDILHEDSFLATAAIKLPENYITLQDIKHVSTLIVATKANFWLTNHHTGQGSAQGYVRKVMDGLFISPDVQSNVTAVHTAGHWAGTIAILAKVGIKGLRNVLLPSNPLFEITFGPNILLWFGGLPAGAHALGIADACATRLFMSQVVGCCPDASSFKSIPVELKKVRSNRVRYHVASQYLTGQQRLFHDPAYAENCLGRLGTFIRIAAPHSTLAKSPHLSKEKVQSYEDYNTDWEKTVVAWREATRKVPDAATLVPDPRARPQKS